MPPGKPNTDEVRTPTVADVLLHDFDEQDLGLESGNLAAMRGPRFYRTLALG